MTVGKCGVGADHVVESVFQDCVYNARDYLGFVLGLSSILTWMVAQLPQVVSNIRNKSAEALSPWFLAEWLMGDTCNLIGCVLTGDQLVTQVYTAVYFIFADITLVLQYLYYETVQHRRRRALRNHQYRLRTIEDGAVLPTSSSSDEAADLIQHARHGSNTKPRVMACIGVVFVTSQLWQSKFQYTVSMGVSGEGLGRRLLEGPNISPLSLGGHPGWSKYVGQIIGWISSVFYLGSRLAQIYKNWSRQSAEGLSIAMFICAITANCLYGAGILLRAYSWGDIISSAPWLLGSLGTVALDGIIYSQFSWYSSKQTQDQESDGLLTAPADE